MSTDVDDDPQVASDSKRGWSSMCRRGDVKMCEVSRARCVNPAHGGRQADLPLIPVSGNREPARKEPEPAAPERDAMTVRQAQLVAAEVGRRRILELLHERGRMNGGNVTHELAALLEYSDEATLGQRLAELDRKGLVERTIEGRRTVAVEITPAGVALLDGDEASRDRATRRAPKASKRTTKKRAPAARATPARKRAPAARKPAAARGGPRLVVDLQLHDLTGDDVWALLSDRGGGMPRAGACGARAVHGALRPGRCRRRRGATARSVAHGAMTG